MRSISFTAYGVCGGGVDSQRGHVSGSSEVVTGESTHNKRVKMVC